jgi:hypothetical protein
MPHQNEKPILFLDFGHGQAPRFETLHLLTMREAMTNIPQRVALTNDFTDRGFIVHQ